MSNRYVRRLRRGLDVYSFRCYNEEGLGCMWKMQPHYNEHENSLISHEMGEYIFHYDHDDFSTDPSEVVEELDLKDSCESETMAYHNSGNVAHIHCDHEDFTGTKEELVDIAIGIQKKLE